MGNGVHSSTVTFCSHCANFTPNRWASEPERFKLSNSVLRAGNGAVAANLSLEGPIWPLLARNGDPMMGTTSCGLQVRKVRFCIAHLNRNAVLP